MTRVLRLPLRSSPQLLDQYGKPIGREIDPSESGRRWEGARTNRLNDANWREAHGRTINQDLATDLQLLCARCELTLQNDPIVAGVVETHCIDMIGPGGPTLQVQSDDQAYNQDLEDLFAQWAERCDYNGQFSLAEMLAMGIRQTWARGEFLWQLVNDFGAFSDPVQLRLLAIHARRLGTPPQSSKDVTLGVRRTSTGRPLSYWIENVDDSDWGGYSTGRFQEYPASDVVHYFIAQEPGQARGFPRLAPALPTAAEVRDFDKQVLDAARAAADHAVLLYTESPEAGYVEVNESVDIERRVMRTLPPGWKAEQMTPNQPHTNYSEFRGERLREIGRPVHMPLMVVNLDSQNHNYSSARFDNQRYEAGVETERQRIGRLVLNRIVRLVAREAQLSGVLGPEPKNARYRWSWQPFAQVDPEKEMQAKLLELQTGLTPYSEMLARENKDPAAVIDLRKRDKEMLEAAGLPTDFSAQPAPAHDQSGSPNQKETANANAA